MNSRSTSAAKLGIDPMLLLRMINGREVPTKAIISGLAKERDSDPRDPDWRPRGLDLVVRRGFSGRFSGQTGLVL
jgi:hypothetical protein